MGRSSTVELRFLVPAVGGSNPSVPAPKNIALQTHMDLERFFVGKRRDSNPQGCEAEEAQSVFQRNTQGAKRRSGPRPPIRRTQNPSVPYRPWAPASQLPARRNKRRDSNPSTQRNFSFCARSRRWIFRHVPKIYLIRRAPQAHKDQERLSSRNISPIPKSEPHATTK